MDDKGNVNEFNALVAECAGSDKEDEQVAYLVKVIMRAMKHRYSVGERIPDSLGIPELEEIAKKDASTACKILDGVYSFVSKSLLDGSIVYIRADAISIMQEELMSRQEIKHGAKS